MHDFYICREGYEQAAVAAAKCVMYSCWKIVTDMMYESCISQNIAYKAKHGQKVK
jgi:hypothetical protein